MTLGGICQSCKRFSPGLFTCHSCGSKVCPLCVVEGTAFCKICQGRKMI
ncbi:MAG: orotate phosphoribosyltransferase [Candidatus Aenigmatarchaeota archaeon]